MPKRSAGLLLYRRREGKVEMLLGHPGGPFWEKKDDGAWSIPKGELEGGEDPLATARREFKEETGFAIEGETASLDPLLQPGGKIVYAWAVERDLDLKDFRSNLFRMEWPPGSGKTGEFPEIDRIAWFPAAEAERKILKGQLGFIRQLLEKLRD